MTDAETMQVYAEAAARYAEGFARTKDTDQEEDYAAFTALLPDGAKVLDLGCGPGHWTARMRGDGYAAEGIDASPEMAAYARDAYGIEVTLADFSALAQLAGYDGIWANFSLLHAPKAAFPTHLAHIRQALPAGGALALGMKLGSGESRDHLGRFYAYYSEEDLIERVTHAGFDVLSTRRGHGEGLAGKPDTFVVLIAQVPPQG